MIGRNTVRLVSTLRSIHPVFAPVAGKHHPKKPVDPNAPLLPLHSQMAIQRDAPLMAVDYSTHNMLDDVNLTIESAHVDASIYAIAGYCNGSFANWAAIVAKWGKAGKFLLSIDVANNPKVGAQCLDIESGDARVADAPAWTKATQAAGKAAKDLRWFPKLYTSEGNLVALVDAMNAAGIKRNEYLIWSAHYGKGAHICGPKSCGSTVQADATQWTSSADGVSLDESLCYGYFFSGPSGEVPGEPAPVPVKVTVPNVIGKTNVEAVAALTTVGLKAGSEAGIAGTVNSQTPAGGVSVVKGSTVDLGVKATPVTPPTPPVAPPSPPPVVVPPAPPTPVVDVPEPSPEPVAAPTGKPAVLVYVQETLTADIADKLGLPVGTILFIPHTVEGA